MVTTCRTHDVDVGASNPRNLCEFLLAACLSRNVRLHQPARATVVTRTADGSLSSITVFDTKSHDEATLACNRLVTAAGAWSPQVFSTLFPESKVRIPITSLSGHALVLRTKRWPPPALDDTDPANAKGGRHGCHAVFTTEAEGGYSPELFSRMPNGEFYLAGLNSSTYPLPAVANERKIDAPSITTLKRTAKRLLGDDAEVTRESVCWRPVTRKGTPIVTALSEEMGQEGEGIFLAAG